MHSDNEASIIWKVERRKMGDFARLKLQSCIKYLKCSHRLLMSWYINAKDKKGQQERHNNKVIFLTSNNCNELAFFRPAGPTKCEQ